MRGRRANSRGIGGSEPIIWGHRGCRAYYRGIGAAEPISYRGIGAQNILSIIKGMRGSEPIIGASGIGIGGAEPIIYYTGIGR
eukprot:scaffold11050_cov116-Isochrysis_galbana.AAC.5